MRLFDYVRSIRSSRNYGIWSRALTLIPLSLLWIALLASPSLAVPLEEWEPEEAKILAHEPVTKADLPDEWQGMNDDELSELLEELMEDAEALAEGDAEAGVKADYEAATRVYSQERYLALIVGDVESSVDALLGICDALQKLWELERSIEYAEVLLAEAKAAGLKKQLADGHSQQGENFYYLWNFDQALAQWESALSNYRETGDRRREGKTLSNIGVVYSDIGKYDAALEHCEQALAIFREVGYVRGEGATLNNIGNVYKDLGKYDAALEYYRQDLSIDREAGDRRGEGGSLVNIGIVYSDIGKYDAALQYYEQALATFREVGDRRGEGVSLINIGLIYRDLGKYDAALDYYEQSLAICRETGDRLREGMTLNNIGNVYCNLGKYDAALKYYEQSLAISREVGDRRGEGKTLGNIGILNADLGRYDAALVYFEQALAIFRELSDPCGEGIALNSIGAVYEDIGEYDTALDYYGNAIEIAVELGARADEAERLVGRADAYRELDDATSAHRDLRQAFDIYSSQATQFTWESGLKGGLTENVYKAGSLLAQVQIDLGKPEEAFAIVQSSKGVPLLQLLAQADEPVENPKVQEALDTYRSAQGYLQTLREQLYELPSEEDLREKYTDESGILDEESFQAMLDQTEGQRDYFTQKIEEYTAQANDRWDFIREHAPEITEIIQVKGLTVEEVQEEILDENQVVLEYLLAEDKVIIFVLPKEGELTVASSPLPELPEDKSFDEWLDQQVALILGPMPEKRKGAARALYDLLIVPVKNATPEGSDLIICPDRSLFIIPFEALTDDENEMLLGRFGITYSTSATMLSYVKPSTTTGPPLVAGVTFGAAEEKAQMEEAFSKLVRSRSAHMIRGSLFERKSFYPLPGVVDETREVGAILAVIPVLDETVTEPYLRENLSEHEVVHLATHGFLSSSPLMNGIVAYLPLREEEQADTEVLAKDVSSRDGFLTMSEVMGIPMAGTELVVLSCCHSAEGEVAAGEGVMGLSQGFIYAGARTIIASLTKVDDTATRMLMEQFYRNWKQRGMNKRDALRAAKQTLAAHPDFSDPRFWAPFVLYGAE